MTAVCLLRLRCSLPPTPVMIGAVGVEMLPRLTPRVIMLVDGVGGGGDVVWTSWASS